MYVFSFFLFLFFLFTRKYICAIVIFSSTTINFRVYNILIACTPNPHPTPSNLHPNFIQYVKCYDDERRVYFKFCLFIYFSIFNNFFFSFFFFVANKTRGEKNILRERERIRFVIESINIYFFFFQMK